VEGHPERVLAAVQAERDAAAIGVAREVPDHLARPPVVDRLEGAEGELVVERDDEQRASGEPRPGEQAREDGAELLELRDHVARLRFADVARDDEVRRPHPNPGGGEGRGGEGEQGSSHERESEAA